MFELKPLSKDAIPKALERADRYRLLNEPAEAEMAGIKVTMWDPATQLRYAKKDKVPPRPDGAPNRWPDERAAESAQLSGMPFGH